MASIALLPACLKPKIRSIQRLRFVDTRGDSRAALWIRQNSRASLSAHGGRLTRSTGKPFCRRPKLNPAVFSNISGRKKHSGMSSLTSDSDSRLDRRQAVAREWKVRSAWSKCESAEGLCWVLIKNSLWRRCYLKNNCTNRSAFNWKLVVNYANQNFKN